ncbi:MAG: hydrogenase formation protein HypD [Pseudomonadota bacterium]
MKFSSEFRDPAKAEALLKAIERTLDGMPRRPDRPIHVMEVCGGHTHSVFRYGLHRLIDPRIEFVHGPGCPVCVLPMGRVDDCVKIAERPEVIFTTFGDAMRVPGSRKSLTQAKADGADIRMVYSPLDALDLARANPSREVVFFGLGFETTMPSTALTILEAERAGIKNFSMLCQHITIIPTLRALLAEEDNQIDGFIGPGHVSMVIGIRGYDFIAELYGKPLVVAGFEPLDILQALLMVLRQLKDGDAHIDNQYARVVPEAGNTVALDAMAKVFEPRPVTDWRGLGNIAQSGAQIRTAYEAFDAEKKFALLAADVPDPQVVKCGEVVKGRMKPTQCPAFGKECTPQNPIGALMVSSEGACAAYAQYAAPRLRTGRAVEVADA